MKRTLSLLLVLCASSAITVAAFQGQLLTLRSAFSVAPSITTATTTTVLYSSTPPPSSSRQPRRNLQKRRRKSREGNSRQAVGHSFTKDAFPWETAESRPMVTTIQQEMGEDYWIDQEELKKVEERQEALKRREPGQISNEKLWSEILSPYKQNWIGIISVVVVVLVTIVTKFPELVEAPTIMIPDL